MTNKNFQVNYQNDSSTIGTNSQNSGLGDWTIGNCHWSGVFSDQTASTSGKNGVSSYWTSSISRQMVPTMIRPSGSVAEAATPTTKLPTPIAQPTEHVI